MYSGSRRVCVLLSPFHHWFVSLISDSNAEEQFWWLLRCEETGDIIYDFYGSLTHPHNRSWSARASHTVFQGV
jgi:hypothetical protein